MPSTLQHETAKPHAPGEATQSRATAKVAIDQVAGSTSHVLEDTLAVEEPLEIQLMYGPREHRQIRSISVTMRTPGDDLHLATGFLMTEGVVRESSDIVSIDYATPDPSQSATCLIPVQGAVLSPSSIGNVVRVELDPSVELNVATLERNFYTTSSCGICGKASLLALQTIGPPRLRNTFTVDAETIYSLPESLTSAQTLFRNTGGIHGAGLFDRHGTLHAAAEDIGRHNAVDKLLGRQFLADRLPLRDRLLMLSGRASFELLQKALMASVPMVVAVGAPSSLAVQVARQFDITLIGFLRDRRFNIYNGAERILRREPQATGD